MVLRVCFLKIMIFENHEISQNYLIVGTYRCRLGMIVLARLVLSPQSHKVVPHVSKFSIHHRNVRVPPQMPFLPLNKALPGD